MSRVSLYKAYLDDEFERDKLKHRHLARLGDSQKLRLLTAIVWDNYIQGKSSLDHATALEVVARELRPPQLEIEGITREFLGRSFLERRGDEYFFAHKSTGEYLFAKQVHAEMRLSNTSFLSGVQHFTGAICGMTLELFGYSKSGMKRFSEALGLDQPMNKGSQARAILFASLAVGDYVAVKSEDGVRNGREILEKATATAKLAEEALGTYRSVNAIPDGKLIKISEQWNRTSTALDRSGLFAKE